MFQNIILIAFLILGTNMHSHAQEIVGPIQGKVNKLVNLTIEKIPEGINDLKITCVEHKMGDGYLLLKTWDNIPIIQIFTEAPSNFTFVIAGNKDNKTLIITKSVSIIDPSPPTPVPVPVPPEPTPGPTPENDLTKRFIPAYKVSPDETARKTIVTLYKDIGNTTYANYQQAGIDLENKSMQLGNSARPLRDEIKKYLIEKLGLNTGSQWDGPLFKKTFLEISDAVAGIK